MLSEEKIIHTIPPVYDKNSKILILGTMPSPKSRETGFYYGHPQNRFWKLMAALFCENISADKKSRTEFLLKHNIALWDVLKSCTIKGADDSSIKNEEANDLGLILRESAVTAIFTTGIKAYKLYNKYCYPETKIKAVALPSTSPANCRFYTFDSLLEKYSVIKSR